MLSVKYGRERWEVLKRLRAKALGLMEALERAGFSSVVYGSVARGDVKPTSDLDIFIPYTVSTQLVELALAGAGYGVYKRVLVQATPSHAVKAYIYLSESDTVSVPLMPLSRDELGFYLLAGSLELDELRRGVRKPGINKELMVIIPTEEGHIEFPAARSVEEAAKVLKVRPEVLRSRIRVLTRRKEVGHTGVFKSIEVPFHRSFEEVFEELVSRNPALRRRLRR
ncbi:MAG TPA: DNA polymerase subunit beta [Candidatus Caldiarchaeum subterraneum]|uniref:protein adenylyltransferase n=1 Tax=Caldiarchaeum subterraneum TaxID=311458 RepID=A0A832ZWE9_CALS0|nr:DNA polymerase subunit beta [Candidatus Caldarchaeum subterraneum]